MIRDEGQTGRPNLQAGISWAAAGLLLLLALPGLARFIGAADEWLDYPYPRAGSEGLILYESRLLQQGGDIYAPITSERFISGPYPPIYYRLASAILPTTLPDFSAAETVTSVFTGGRLISLGSTLAAALLVGVLAVLSLSGRGGRRGVLCGVVGAAIGGMVFVALPQVVVWSTRFRGDMLMIALTAGGLVCIASGAREHTRWAWLGAGAVLFALAFYTKQTALAGPAAAALFLLVRDWRAGLKWCAGMFVCVLVPFIVLEIVTGHWFFLKMVDYHSLPLRRLTLERLLQFALFEDQWPLLLLTSSAMLVVLFILGRAFYRRQSDQSIRQSPQLLIHLFVLASFVTLPTGAVVGADHNHLLMIGLAMAASTGAVAAWLLERLTRSVERVEEDTSEKGQSEPSSWSYADIAGLAAPLIAIFLLMTSAPSTWYNPDLSLPTAGEQEQLRKIVLNVQQNPGSLIFSDDPGIAALAGKETRYDDPFTMTALAQQGRWDESVFREQLRAGQFAMLVLSCDVTLMEGCRGDTFTPGVLDAIRDGYDLLFRDVLFTYVPKVSGAR